MSDPEEIARQINKNLEKGERTERPEEILLTDKPILLTILSWIATITLILWLKNNNLIN